MKNESRFLIISAPNRQASIRDIEVISNGNLSPVEIRPKCPFKTARKDHGQCFQVAGKHRDGVDRLA